jgi:methionyl-tRNA formyltransferase
MGQIVFLTSLDDRICRPLLTPLGDHIVVRSAAELTTASGDILLSYGTSLIVPQDQLDRFRAAYNVHAASPDYPGRDPHHFAIYDGVKRYGATCHVMTSRVDEGPIVDVEWFDVAPEETPESLLKRADQAAVTIIHRLGPRLRSGPLPPIGQTWGHRKTKRSDFLAMCQISPDISREEFDRRFRAFNSGHHSNLIVEVQGKTFRIDNDR